MSGSYQPVAIDAQPSLASPARSLAYLASTYSALSMVFVSREVLQLRELGFQIDVASINPPDRPLDELTATEAAEATRTYCVKAGGAVSAAIAHLRVAVTEPAGYLTGLRWVVRLAGIDPERLIFNFLYFTEALMVGSWMKRKSQSHLHVHLGSQAATVGLFVHHVFGFGYSITFHGPDEFYDARGQYLQEKIAAARFICCISSFTRSQLMMHSPYSHWNKFVLSRVGIDTHVFAPRPKKSPGGTFEILCIGRLTPAKGQHLLIDAVDRLNQPDRQGPRALLHIAGQGPDESSLRQHAAKIGSPASVVFEGAVNKMAFVPFMQRRTYSALPALRRESLAC